MTSDQRPAATETTPPVSTSVAHRTAVVTGSCRGIGAAIVQSLLATGQRVITCGRSARQVHEAVATLHDRGWSQAVGFTGDLTSASSRTELLSLAGRIDVLVNNAGGFVKPTTTSETAPSEWEQHLNLNLTLPFLMCQTALPGMLQQGWGRIVNIGSIAAVAPQMGNAIGYVAAKAGLLGFTRQLAAEVAGTGITANVINPGTVATAHLRDYLKASAIAEGSFAERIPVGRLGKPHEIGAIVPYLVSDDAGFMTGAVINIDGGAIHA